MVEVARWRGVDGVQVKAGLVEADTSSQGQGMAWDQITDEGDQMIVVTRLNGSPLALNCDLIESVDSEPETTVVLVDGSTHQVQESLEDVVDRVREFRASVVILAQQFDDQMASEAQLHVLRPQQSSEE